MQKYGLLHRKLFWYAKWVCWSRTWAISKRSLLAPRTTAPIRPFSQISSRWQRSEYSTRLEHTRQRRASGIHWAPTRMELLYLSNAYETFRLRCLWRSLPTYRTCHELQNLMDTKSVSLIRLHEWETKYPDIAIRHHPSLTRMQVASKLQVKYKDLELTAKNEWMRSVHEPKRLPGCPLQVTLLQYVALYGLKTKPVEH